MHRSGVTRRAVLLCGVALSCCLAPLRFGYPQGSGDGTGDQGNEENDETTLVDWSFDSELMDYKSNFLSRDIFGIEYDQYFSSLSATYNSPNRAGNLDPEVNDIAVSRSVYTVMNYSEQAIPSPATTGTNVFDRVHEMYRLHFGSHSQTSAAVDRLISAVTQIAKLESSQWMESKKTAQGLWARDAARGPFSSGQWKCNIAVSEWLLREGIRPIYINNDPRQGFANTDFMVNNRESLSCWKPTNTPDKGNLIVYLNHVGVVTDPARHLAVSAGKTHVQERTHWGLDSAGVPRAVSNRSELNSESLSDHPQAYFLEYNCPDIRTSSHYFYDQVE